MEKRTSFKLKYKNIYIFISLLSLIGFITGYKYYSYQSKETKTQIQDSLQIKEELNGRINNLFKRIKNHIIIFICSIFIIISVINVFKIFFDSLSIGFIFNILKTYGTKFSLIYINLYHIVPLIFQLILIRISFTITKLIIGSIIYQKDKIIVNKLKLIIKKYILIVIFSCLYEIFVIIYSANINNFLLTLIK